MNYKVKTSCEKLFPGCYGDKPRVYAKKDDAESRCAELNEQKVPTVPCPKCKGEFKNCDTCQRTGEVSGPEVGLTGTFFFAETLDVISGE